jgi:WD40 repeat protein
LRSPRTGAPSYPAGSDKTLKLWDIATGREIRTFVGHTDSVIAVAFSPDGRNALSGSSDRTLKFWDVATGKEIRTLAGHTSWVSSVACSLDGRSVLSGSLDDTLKLWDVATGTRFAPLPGTRTRSLRSPSRPAAKPGCPGAQTIPSSFGTSLRPLNGDHASRCEPVEVLSPSGQQRIRRRVTVTRSMIDCA